MSILKREARVLTVNLIAAMLVGLAVLGIFFAGLLIGLGMGFESGRYIGNLEATRNVTQGFVGNQAYYGAPEPGKIITITRTTVSDPTCKEIMELYAQLPIDELVDRPAFLDQVGDCTLKALEPDCETLDIACHIADAWHSIVD